MHLKFLGKEPRWTEEQAIDFGRTFGDVHHVRLPKPGDMNQKWLQIFFTNAEDRDSCFEATEMTKNHYDGVQTCLKTDLHKRNGRR